MSAQLAATGRLGRDPRSIPTRTGKAMAAVSLAVEVPCRNEGEDGATLWVDVLGFGRVADDLLRHSRGDSVSVFGRLALNRFQSSGGEARETWQVVADAVVSVRTVAPSERRRGERGETPDRPADGHLSDPNAPPLVEPDLPF